MKILVVVAMFCTILFSGIEVISKSIEDAKSKNSYMENVLDKLEQKH
ncbi:hypothetical protein [Aliarcobacter butzleri]|jgi:uncharacterized protein YaaN involved in tellurite resistance|nr:hypothetical protein [Aliarcobacter butzleri]